MSRASCKILLVDDEYLALQLLEEYLRQVPGTAVVAKCKSALEALAILEREQIDVMFLDIQMPTLSGVDFLRGLQEPPATIFTTAYRDYAVDAFELDAVDYLVKPFSLSRFLQALQKARRANKDATAPRSDHLTVKVDGKLVRIDITEIQYVEGMREYVRIVCENGKYVTFERMKNMEEILPASDFMRVHKSYLVARNKVVAIEGNLLEIGAAKIPISRSLRAQVIEELFT